MDFLTKLIRSFWPFLFFAFALFGLGVLINSVLQVPAEGVLRLPAFIPFAAACIAKARTFWE